jgi:hypothetical protein
MYTIHEKLEYLATLVSEGRKSQNTMADRIFLENDLSKLQFLINQIDYETHKDS